MTSKSYRLDRAGGDAWLAENGLFDPAVVEVELVDEGVALVTRLVKPVGGVHNEADVLRIRHRVALRSLPPREIIVD